MIPRDSLRTYLISIGCEAQADDVASLAFAEKVIEGLAEVTPEMPPAGLSAHCQRKGLSEPPLMDGLRETYAAIYRAMFDARFKE